MIEYLMTAYERQTACERQNAEAGVSTPVFPTFFPPSGQRRRPGCFEGQKGFYCTNTGVPIDEHTWKAAVASAHCAIAGARALRSGESRVYALCRPPGHHAGPDFFGGYCYLNNAAIAAQVLCENGERVAILDIDYHHGNGTQAIFYAEPQAAAQPRLAPDAAIAHFERRSHVVVVCLDVEDLSRSRMLGYYVRELGVISLEEAIWKMCGLPAKKLRWTDRGLVKEGFQADLVVLEPETVADRATFQNPHQYPVGIQQVVVNGKLVIQDEVHTRARPGGVLGC